MMHSIYIQEPIDSFLRAVPGDSVSGHAFYGDAVFSTEHAYMYGTTFKKLAKDEVILDNPLLPSGTPVYRWDNLYSYNSARTIHQLPLLKEGHHYQLHLLAEANHQPGLYLRVLMFDLQGELVAQRIIKDSVGIFTYEEGAYAYSIELVSAGTTRVVFHRLDLVDVTDQVADEVEPIADDEIDVIVPPTPPVEVNYEQGLVINQSRYEERLAVVNQYLSVRRDEE